MPLGKLSLPQQVKKFLAFCSTPNIRCRLSENSPLVNILTQTNPVHAIQSYFPNNHFNILIPLKPRPSKGISFLQVYQSKYCLHFCPFPHAPHFNIITALKPKPCEGVSFRSSSQSPICISFLNIRVTF